MNEQQIHDEDDDVQGHARVRAAEDDDVQGHMPRTRLDGDEDDVSGHMVNGKTIPAVGAEDEAFENRRR